MDEVSNLAGEAAAARDEVEAEARVALGRARELLDDLLVRMESAIRARPGTALLVAVGLGFVVGRMIRRGG